MASNREAVGAYPPGRPVRAYGVDHEHPDHVVRRISPWAVLAGAVVGVVVLFLLGLLGLAIGLATIDPAARDTPGAGALSTGTAIWGIISFLVALFAAGWIAGRLAGDPKKLDGLLQGVVAWAVTALVIMWLMTTTVSSVIGGAFSLLGNVASASAQAVQEAVSQVSGQPVADAVQQIPWEQVRQRVEQALPADVNVDREALMAAFRELVLEGGDRQAVIDVLVQQGGLSQQEAESTLQNLETQYQQAVQEIEQQAREAAQGAAEAVSSAALWSFIALLLGAIAAAAGGWLGAPRDEIVAETVVR